MKRLTIATALAIALLPIASFAGQTRTKSTSSSVYICSKCHMKFSAVEAKKDHYKDPMDGGSLVAGKPGSHKASKTSVPTSMGSMGM